MRSGPIHLLLAHLLALCAVAPALAERPSVTPRTRIEFAAAISQVKKGMRENEVFALLGRPDDVWRERDLAEDDRSSRGNVASKRFWTSRKSTIMGGSPEVWRYGCSRHWTIATLGQVEFDHRGQVHKVIGQGKAPPEGYFEEEELRHLLEVLGQVLSLEAGRTYNPRRVIEAVNLLQPLGTQKALTAIDEFLRVCDQDPFQDHSTGMCLVLRTLFEVPDDAGHLKMLFPELRRPRQKNPLLISRFPIAVEGDIPFLSAEYYASETAAHVAHYRKHGTIRALPLVPSATPWESLDKLSGALWKRPLVEHQALRLLDTVYRIEPGQYGENFPDADDEAQAERRRKIIEEISNLKIRWDPPTNRYTFLDGSTLPEPQAKHYRRDVWKPVSPGLDLVLVVERTSASTVSISLRENLGRPLPRPKMVLRIFNIDSKDKNLLEFKVDDAANMPRSAYKESTLRGSRAGASWTGQIIDLEDGAKIQAEYSLDGKVQLSPTYKP